MFAHISLPAADAPLSLSSARHFENLMVMGAIFHILLQVLSLLVCLKLLLPFPCLLSSYWPWIKRLFSLGRKQSSDTAHAYTSLGRACARCG